MSQSKPGRRQPSPTYVFVVFALAAFMVLLAFWRAPGIWYLVRADVVRAATPSQRDDQRESESLAARAGAYCRDVDAVLSALRRARLIEGETSPRMLVIARRVAKQLTVDPITVQSRPGARIGWNSESPTTAASFLTELSQQFARQQPDAYQATPAQVAGQRGGSIPASRLVVLAMLSSVAGFVGVWLAERGIPAAILSTDAEVTEVTGVPVVNLQPTRRNQASPASHKHQRVFRASLAAAEWGIVAVFLLMVSQVATQRAFFWRLLGDPLAAYGEALTRVVG